MEIRERIDVVFSVIFYSACVLVFTMYLTACSVKFELGYHGETGRDDRTQTQAKK